MDKIRELLRDADPVQYESTPSLTIRDVHRRAVLAAGLNSQDRSSIHHSHLILAAVVFVLVIAASLGIVARSVFITDLEAAVRFEVKLAESQPGPGLREAKLSGSDRSVYLHDEVIVANSDIAAARVIQGNQPSQFWISVEFTASGAEKMRTATGDHIGRPVAILLDGRVEAAFTLRSPIGESAVINGNLTRAQAERIAGGITVP
jgi:preprotein translocase subunit SecD